MLATKQLTVAIDFHSVGKNLQKKETHSGLKQHEGEQMMTELYFLGWTIRLIFMGRGYMTEPQNHVLCFLMCINPTCYACWIKLLNESQLMINNTNIMIQKLH